jgi:hypothetical protein
MADESFEREKVCYEQNFEQARSLNEQMNKVPLLAMTLSGGLWFAAGAIKDVPPAIRFLLLLFTGFCNLALILVTIRIRDVFHSYLEQIKAFHPSSFVTGRPTNPRAPGLRDYSMITIYCILMAIAALLSFCAAISWYWPFECVSRWIGLFALGAILLMLFDALISRKVLRLRSAAESASNAKSVRP